MKIEKYLMNDMDGSIIAYTDEGCFYWVPTKEWVKCSPDIIARIDCGYNFDWDEVSPKVAEARIADISENGYGEFDADLAIKQFKEKMLKEGLEIE